MIWDIVVLGFWIGVGLFLLNIAFTVLMYIIVGIVSGIGWVIEKAKGE